MLCKPLHSYYFCNYRGRICIGASINRDNLIVFLMAESQPHMTNYTCAHTHAAVTKQVNQEKWIN